MSEAVETATQTDDAVEAPPEELQECVGCGTKLPAEKMHQSMGFVHVCSAGCEAAWLQDDPLGSRNFLHGTIPEDY